jgi:S-adenosylmethionine:tRNA ribosyltransferase-isomerase
MHTEQIMVSRKLLQDLLRNQGKVIAVGTTSVRTLESLYWYGAKIAQEPTADFHIPQLFPYQNKDESLPTPENAIKNLLLLMETKKQDVLHGSTQMMIVPGYQFRIISGMITNFHQPRSTLLLLISAWLGQEWKRVYEYALDNDFRFLSYGDSCLFL